MFRIIETAEQLNKRGDSFYFKEKYPEAMECYEEALRIDPNYKLAYYNLGVALRKMGK